jgi:hypothetical protein
VTFRRGPRRRRLGFRRPELRLVQPYNPAELVLTNDGDLVRRDLADAVVAMIVECDRILESDGRPPEAATREARWIEWIQRYPGPIDDWCRDLFNQAESARCDG